MAIPVSDMYNAARPSVTRQMLTRRPALALAVSMVPGMNPDGPASLHLPSMVVYPIADPILLAMVDSHGATIRGGMTVQMGLGRRCPIGAIDSLLAHSAPGIVIPEGWAWTGTQRINRRNLEGIHYSHRRWQNDVGTREPGVYQAFERASLRHNQMAGRDLPFRTGNPAMRGGVITFGVGHNSLWFKFFTNGLEIPAHLADEVGRVDLNLRPTGASRRDPKPIRPAAAVAVAEWARANGFLVVDPTGNDDLARVSRTLSRSVVAWSRAGRPAQAHVSIGAEVPRKVASELTTVSRKRIGDPVRSSRVVTVNASALAALAGKYPVISPPAVADVASLAAATPVDDARLRDFQRQAVGCHIATKVGYLNASSTGSGKSIMVLDGMRRRAVNIPGWRGLIVAEANVRKQFANEARLWFPTAWVIVADRGKSAEMVAQTISDAGDFPVLIVTSYALAATLTAPVELDARTAIADLFADDQSDVNPWADATNNPAADIDAAHEAVTEVTAADVVDATDTPVVPTPTVTLGQVLTGVHWHDLVADEAACLRNPASKQSKAMWVLRRNADVAVALTATPISRGLDDLGHILAWVRNDRHLFDGVKLADTFDLSTDEGLAEFSDAIGPVLVRHDKSAFAEELPDVADPIIVHLDPTHAELRLAESALHELRRAYDELVSWMDQVAAGNPSNAAYADARTQLVAARAAWLGGTTLARMASSDPAALLGSKSAGAALLAAHGLIADATTQTGTKRAHVVKMCADRVAAGERIVVFTEFSTVAHGLIEDLREAGLRVGEILGGGGRKRDDYLDSFRRGELDVMVSTSAGERGLNLQTATTLIHYDLPWTPDGIVQRTGRLERIGSTADRIQVIFPIMRGTVEERVVAVVVSRAAAAMRALDGARGVSAIDTELGRALGGLANAADESQLSGKDAALLSVTRAMLNAAA